MAEKYYTFSELLEMIDKPNQTACQKIYDANKEMFDKAKGSTVKHQAWKGGYLGHITEVMNIAIRIYNSLEESRKFPFTLSDCLVVLFLHDLEKPWKYGGTDEEKAELQSYPNNKEFIRAKIIEYGFHITSEEWNGLQYVHGEGEDYDPSILIQSPLAALVHCCDTISARIWYDYPKKKDSW